MYVTFRVLLWLYMRPLLVNDEIGLLGLVKVRVSWLEHVILKGKK